MMTPTTLLPAIAFFTLVTVEFGGWSLLGLIGTNTLTPFQERFFRAGHAHAGTLLVLALVSFVFLARTNFSVGAQWGIGVALLAGIVMQSGGFFLHMLVGAEGAGSIGTLVTRVGGIVLAGSLITLGVGVLRAQP